MKLILVRHGQSEANANSQHQGKGDKWSNTPLTKKGQNQAKQVAERLKIEKIDKIYSSPLKRAKQTAKAINKFHNKKIIIDKRIKEKYDKEDLEDFIKRVKDFFMSRKKESGTFVVVAHGGVNATLLVISTGSRKKGGRLVRDIRLHNTSVSILEKQGEHYKIHLKNCIKHLKPEKEVVKIFKKVQKIPYQVCSYNPEEINTKLIKGDCRHKSKLLVDMLKKRGYKAKRIIVIFNWKDLPLPKKILKILKKSSTIWTHYAVAVKIHGNYLYLDPTWNPELEKKGFPITKRWNGLEDTKQITKGKLEFFRKSYFEENKNKILKRHKIKIDKKEARLFDKKLNGRLKR